MRFAYRTDVSVRVSLQGNSEFASWTGRKAGERIAVLRRAPKRALISFGYVGDGLTVVGNCSLDLTKLAY